MSFTAKSLSDFVTHPFDLIIDVRSPAEFAEDHLPGATSLPVLSNDERATVGTIYVQESKFEARKVGAALVARNAAHHLENDLSKYDGSFQPLVYCWRGGQRSSSFATILKAVGWRVEVLEGGYRSYRRAVVDAMYETPLPHRLTLLDGNTGTAKTAVLQALKDIGVQVVDLEGLANHRGSLFGHVGAQPSQKLLEGRLAMAFAALDPEKPVIVEAESSKIGDRTLPPSVWKAMQDAPRITLSAPLQARAQYLAQAYEDISADQKRLSEALTKLIPIQGRERIEAWRSLAAAGQFPELAAALMEHHYDPRYARQREQRGATTQQEVRLSDLTPTSIAIAAREIAAAL